MPYAHTHIANEVNQQNTSPPPILTSASSLHTINDNETIHNQLENEGKQNHELYENKGHNNTKCAKIAPIGVFEAGKTCR